MDLRGIRGIAVAAAVTALAQPALAATSLCVENAATGFNWNNGQWVQTNFQGEQHIVRMVEVGEAVGDVCYSLMAKAGHSTEVFDDRGIITSFHCYSAYAVGQEETYFDVSWCEEYWLKGEILSIKCSSNPSQEFDFLPNGEFLMKRTAGVPLVIEQPQPRDSLVIAIGKCSVIAP